jgi:site-specific DNA-methyltransferase (adenine-specific)
MTELRNQIVHGDCIEVLQRAQEPFADLVFADPPFNIGYQYDTYRDKKKKQDYHEWTEQWMSQCCRVLKPHGSFYVAIGDEHAADVKVSADRLKLTMRNWIIWHYSFGQQMKRKFARAHAHIFYFVKDKKEFVFNDGLVRVISDRQKKYADKRANPAGKMPDDVWDEYPRVCGTFRERTGFPCQMPESLLARIIRVSSNEGDWVLDPFCGSGTTPTVAHKLGRAYTAIDLSREYVQEAQRRIRESEGLPVEGNGTARWTRHADLELKWLYSENKFPVAHLCKHRMLLSLVTSKLNDRLAMSDPYSPDEVSERLDHLERTAQLAPLDKMSPAQAGARWFEE